MDIDKIKKFLRENKLPIGQTLQIVQGPPAALLGVMVFDQSREVKEMNENSAIGFLVNIDLGSKLVTMLYFFKLDREKVTIDGGNIVVEAIVAPCNKPDPKVIKEKFIFLPKGSRVLISYNQDMGTGTVTKIMGGVEKKQDEAVAGKEKESMGANAEAEEFLVRVEGWSKPRELRLRDGYIYFGVVKADCHCNTCVNRFVTLIRYMDKNNIPFEAGSWGMDTTLRFSIEDGVDPLDTLSSKIGLRVTRA